MWYAVHVNTGREEAACELIKFVGRDVVDECFVLRYRTMKKRDGVPMMHSEAMFPGYVIVVTDHVRELERALPKYAEFTKLLRVDQAFVPLNDEEVAWIDGLTRKGRRTVEMSTGYACEGGGVTVFEGPLVDREDWIRKVNHRKKLAYLEIPMFGQKVSVEAGLKIVRKHS